MIDFVPADSGYSPGNTFQVSGEVQPNYVIYMYAGQAGYAYGKLKAPAGAGGTLTVKAIVEAYEDGNVTVKNYVTDINTGLDYHNPAGAPAQVALVTGINTISLTTVTYNGDDVLFFEFDYYAASQIDAGVIGWSIE